ncbi:MAG: hypothetical protein NVS4B3_23920 [Gemmatimonadaceae bacterium]
MDELINLISQRAGISPEQAQTAVDTVVSHLKGRLPASLSSHLDGLLAGGGGLGADGAMGGLAKGLGGLFGRKE